MDKKILIGNSFPLSLIRKNKVEIQKVPLINFKRCLNDAEIFSFWGHRNTLKVAEQILGVSLEPRTERPAIELNELCLPTLYGETFDECWVLSPNYIQGFRPSIGEEVKEDQISDWIVLKINWKKEISNGVWSKFVGKT